MAWQVYRCPKHGEFEVKVSVKEDVSLCSPCPTCKLVCPWVPSAPNFIGGPTTGAERE